MHIWSNDYRVVYGRLAAVLEKQAILEYMRLGGVELRAYREFKDIGAPILLWLGVAFAMMAPTDNQD